jgi:hypothetical protein
VGGRSRIFGMVIFSSNRNNEQPIEGIKLHISFFNIYILQVKQMMKIQAEHSFESIFCLILVFLRTSIVRYDEKDLSCLKCYHYMLKIVLGYLIVFLFIFSRYFP